MFLTLLALSSFNIILEERRQFVKDTMKIPSLLCAGRFRFSLLSLRVTTAYGSGNTPLIIVYGSICRPLLPILRPFPSLQITAPGGKYYALITVSLFLQMYALSLSTNSLATARLMSDL